LVDYWQILGPLILGAAGGAGLCAASLGEARRLRRVVAALLSGAARERNIVRARRILSRRPRRRYIVFEVIPGGFREAEVWEAIKATAERFAGLLGLALSGLALVDYDEERSRGIVRVRREYKGLALTVLSLTRRISGVRVLIVPLATTGSIKRARRLLRPP
jgi:ribonuclease P/MRP protein subunit POP5